MDFAQQQRDPRRHLAGISTVILLHAIAIYALTTGLARKVVDVLKKPLEVNIIEEIKTPPPPPPPPKVLPTPRQVVEPPPAYVPPPEVQVQAPPVQAVISVTTATPPPPVVVVAPTVAPPPPVANVSVACPNHLEVRSHLPYPPMAQQMELSGDVLIEFTVTSAGQISDVTVVNSSNRIFNNTATNAVKQLHCIGQGRDVKVHVPFTFRMDS
jgi:protein TonB